MKHGLLTNGGTCSLLSTQQRLWYGGIISYHGTGRISVVEDLMNKEKYVKDLESCVLFQMRDWFGKPQRGIFMKDGAPCHTAKVCSKFLQDKNIRKLPWSGNLPDLKPIENIWSIVKHQVTSRTINTRQEMISTILKCWFRDVTFVEKIRNCIDSMPEWLKAVISAKGGHTKF